MEGLKEYVKVVSDETYVDSRSNSKSIAIHKEYSDKHIALTAEQIIHKFIEKDSVLLHHFFSHEESDDVEVASIELDNDQVRILRDFLTSILDSNSSNEGKRLS